MNTVTSSTQGSAESLLQPSTGVKQQTLAQTDFLKLLTAQLKHQDPFAPMDNSEMVAQMATISNTTGIAEMNTALKSIEEQLSGNRLGDAASWIGHSMLVTSNIAAPDATGTYAGQFTLAEAADAVSLDLLDGDGNVVKTIDMGARDAGETSFYWDGRNENGDYIAGDKLQVKVRGATPSHVGTWASVAAVQSPADGSASKLITAIGSFTPADAIKLT